MSAPESSELSAWIQAIIRDFLDDPSENSLQTNPAERFWDAPITGFSRGDDPLYLAFKEHIGAFHWTPAEIFDLTFPAKPAEPRELTIISWVLPNTRATREDNREETVYPCERWARSRTFGEEVNIRLRQQVVSVLQKAGYDAVAPVLSPGFTWQNSQTYGFASSWSERHAAFASGLGTFGLCDGLITSVGKSMRTGSVVSRIPISPSPRPYSTHTEYCLYYSRGACKKCISRCPAGAITEAGHDKAKCFDHVFNVAIPYIKTHYGFDGYSCGLCQTGVPCESGIPVKT